MTSDRPFMPLAGGCQCGRVRFCLERAPIITHCCHCRTCQKVSGSAFRINAMVETDRLSILAGEAQPFRSADGQQDVRCRACGQVLWAHIAKFGEAIAFVGAGLLDEGERLVPEAHYFTRSRHPWVVLPPGVPAFETLGDPGKAGARERLTAALARGARLCAGETHR